MKTLFAITISLALASSSFAGGPGTSNDQKPCCYETQFRQGSVGCAPQGHARGEVLYVDCSKHPVFKARMQGVAWKGKTFHCDGSFTNRWLGNVHAISACVRVEPSWLDGQPCFVMQYAPNAPIFGNVRDELREIEPGVWLGRSYEGATGRPKNWFILRGK